MHDTAIAIALHRIIKTIEKERKKNKNKKTKLTNRGERKDNKLAWY